MNDNKNEGLNKNVDESWKQSVEKEKAGAGSEGHSAEAEKGIEVNFILFISGLMMEGLIALGEVEHPVTKKKEPNLLHSKFIIDTLDMLKEKTKNNLTKEEGEALDAVLYELRMRYVAKTKK